MVSAEAEGAAAVTMMQSAASADPLSPEASYLRGMAGYPGHPGDPGPGPGLPPHPHHPHMQVPPLAWSTTVYFGFSVNILDCFCACAHN